jgi:8-oxo-dGTP pyrophosphatase MutT (NUDIX family)
MEEIDRPGPGEELNRGKPTPPREASTVIILRGGERALEILLVRRNPAARFMGGAWVFPGGAVDGGEGAGETALRRAAVREVAEEAGIDLPDPGGMVKFSRWITPAQVRTRYDTHFYLAPLPDGAEPTVDGQECVEWRWFTPPRALEAHRRAEILLVFPTIKHLEQLSRFASVDELLTHARGKQVQPVVPRVEVEGETARILLPGEPGYDAPPAA